MCVCEPFEFVWHNLFLYDVLQKYRYIVSPFYLPMYKKVSVPGTSLLGRFTVFFSPSGLGWLTRPAVLSEISDSDMRCPLRLNMHLTWIQTSTRVNEFFLAIIEISLCVSQGYTIDTYTLFTFFFFFFFWKLISTFSMFWCTIVRHCLTQVKSSQVFKRE